MEERPDIPDGNVERRFTKLLREPLEQLRGIIDKFVLVFEALDECSGPDRAEILYIVSDVFHQLPECAKLFVTSRPDPDIVAAFQNIKCETILPTSEENLADINEYARLRLKRTNSSVAQLDNMLLTFGNKLTNASGGLFVWAKLALDMVDKANTIEEALTTLEKVPVNSGDLYKRVFDAALKHHKGVSLPLVMRTIVTLLEPLSPEGLAELMGVGLQDIQNALSTLGAVLVIDMAKVRLLHKSVADYVLNSPNSEFYVHRPISDRQLAVWCLERLLSSPALRPNVCQLDPQLPNAEQDLDRRIQENVPESIQYACRYWMVHLLTDQSIDSGASEKQSPDYTLSSLVTELYSHMLFYWLEIVALLDSLNTVVRQSFNLRKWWKLQHPKSLFKKILVKLPARVVDSWDPKLLQPALCMNFASRISVRTPHLWLSAFPLIPHDTALNRIYQPQITNIRADTPSLALRGRSLTVPIASGTLGKWSRVIISLEEVDYEATAHPITVGISQDEKIIAVGWSNGKASVWDAVAGSFIRQFKVHHTEVDVALNFNGSLMATGSLDGSAKLVNVMTGAVTRVLDHGGPISHVTLSANAEIMATISRAGSVVLWDKELLIKRIDMTRLIITPAEGLPSADQQLVILDGQGSLAINYGDQDAAWVIIFGDPLVEVERESGGKLTIAVGGTEQYELQAADGPDGRNSVLHLNDDQVVRRGDLGSLYIL
ncbi:hypothetical protein HDV00_004872 [Rhizophlyctis rosea]|nr:hypothetical protein HDV00_004872 [Rhizophlyctis rosea]